MLVTAGPTHEPIDAVRYIGNRSSGRMGIAIASAAVLAGCPTTLALGPVPMSDREIDAVFPPTTSGAGPHQLCRFRTADDLRTLLAELAPAADILIMAAAVADFRPRSRLLDRKIERGAALTLELEPVPDLLAEVASRRREGQTLVGFALEEPTRVEERARTKLDRKGLDAIVANPLETMESAGVAAQLFLAEGPSLPPRVERPPGWPAPVTKEAFATWLIGTLLRRPASRPPV